MHTLMHNDFDPLIACTTSPCVSIYMPTRRYGSDIRPELLELQRLFKQVVTALIRRGMGDRQIEQLLDPALRFLYKESNWRGANKGLAIFMAPGFFRHFDSPVDFASLGVVGDRFHLLPLFTLAESDGTYYLLLLGKAGVRLFEGTRQSIRSIPLKGIAASLREYQKYTHGERELQLHSGVRLAGAEGRTGGIFHGGGNAHDREKLELTEYFRSVDKGIRKHINSDTAPMVLGGVEYLAAIYRQITESRNILDEELGGNAASFNMQELHGRSWRIAEPYFQRANTKAREKFARLLGTGLASMDAAEVMDAADHGRIESLFVTSDVLFEDMGDEIVARGALANLAAIETHETGGAVFSVAPGSIEGNSIAAVFRY